MKLLEKQEHAIYYLRQPEISEVVYGGAAGGGKSALECMFAIEMSQQYPGARGVLGRSNLKTLKETTLNTFFQLASHPSINVRNQFEYNQQAGIIKWHNGSDIILKDFFLYPSDPEFDKLGSLELTYACVDEISQISYKAWQVLKSRIRYKLEEFNLTPKILGTCNPSKGWVYNEFYKPSVNGTLKNYRAFVKALPKDNPHLPESYLQSLLQLDENSKQRLYYGNWEYDDDPTALLNYADIEAIFTNVHAVKGRKYIIGDIARYGADRAILTVWEGWAMIDYCIMDISSTQDIHNRIMAFRKKYGIHQKDVILDEDGVGGGIVDLSGATGFVNNSRPFRGQYANLKCECGYQLAEQIHNIQIECELPTAEKDMIIQELEQLKTYDVDKDLKLRILPKAKIKENIGRSPDWLDTFIMRMLPVIRPNVKTIVPKSNVPKY